VMVRDAYTLMARRLPVRDKFREAFKA